MGRIFKIKWSFRIFILLQVFFYAPDAFSTTDKYRLILRDDPSTTVGIAWNQVSGIAPLVYYGEQNFGNELEKYPHKHMPDRSVRFKGMNNQFAHLEYLKPDTRYYFIIVDENSQSEVFWFKTFPDNADSRLSIVAGGDSRNHRDVRQNANRMVAKLRPHMVLFGGDMVRSGSDEQWQGWFDDWQFTTTFDNQLIPILATRGNHEKNNDIIYNLFDTPNRDIYYALNFCNNLLRVYTLNTEISIRGRQTEWLKEDLEKHGNVKWKIAQYHKPMRPHVLRKFEGEESYLEWAPLFYQHRVRLAIECDAHTVKTTWPIKPAKTSWQLEGFIRDDENGTVYAGEGCWGAPTRAANDPKEWTHQYGEFNQFKWIFIDKDKLELRTVMVDHVENVTALTSENMFSIPDGLPVWQPNEEEKIILYP